MGACGSHAAVVCRRTSHDGLGRRDVGCRRRRSDAGGRTVCADQLCHPGLDGLVRLSELVRAGTDFSGCRVYLTTDLNAAGKSFSTIGLYSYPYETAVPFNGLFDGQGHTISGLSGVQGLFGCIGKQGVVRNLTVASDLQAESYVGGVAVYNYGLVERCVNTGDISNTDKTSAAGGLVGANYGTVRRPGTNSGTISGHKVGGMVGIHPTGAVNPVVEICTNSGTVDGTSSSGGLVGASIVTATVQNCENTGTVKGSGNMGGIVGMAGNTTVRNCANHAEIGGSGDMGGIVGTAVYGSAIYNCYSSWPCRGHGRSGRPGWPEGRRHPSKLLLAQRHLGRPCPGHERRRGI